ncbi:MAG TPA: glycosyltransferase family 39 protein [Dongiaceae bacterium]|nr:glycosyltransferase family 39 protein [Dongiaceae bacterium]
MKRSRLTSGASALLLLLIAAAGAALRLHLLARRDFWVDEALSVFLARLPWREFWAALWNFQANMGLYYFLLRGWLHLGDGEATVRALSVLFGVAVIPATYLLGRRLFDEKAAIASAALAAVNVFQIRYSQEARGYSLVMLLVVLSTYLFLRALESPKPARYWAGYALVSALGTYVHLFVYLVIAAHWLSLGSSRLRSLPCRTIFLSAAGFALLTAPLDIFILFRERGQLSWVPHPTLQLVLGFSKLFAGNGGLPLVGAYAALCFIALVPPASSPASKPSGLDERWSARLVATWLLFPIAATLLVSLVKPVFYDRFMAVSAPALALLAGQGLSRLGRAPLRLRGLYPASVLAMVGASLWGVHRYDHSRAAQGDHWREAVRYILAAQQPQDAVFLYRASGAWPFQYYARREMEARRAAGSPTVVFPLDASNAQQDPDERQARLAIEGQRRVWLVLQHYGALEDREAAKQAIEGAFQDGYQVYQKREFHGVSGPIRVLLYVRDTSAAPPIKGMAKQPWLTPPLRAAN